MSEKDNKNEPKEQEYMKESKETIQHPPNEREGTEKPRVTGYRKVQTGLIIFIIICVILLIIGYSMDMFGIFSE